MLGCVKTLLKASLFFTSREWLCIESHWLVLCHRWWQTLNVTLYISGSVPAPSLHPVILAPYGLSGVLTGRSVLPSDQSLADWQQFYPLSSTAGLSGSNSDNELPAMVEVAVGRWKQWFTTNSPSSKNIIAIYGYQSCYFYNPKTALHHDKNRLYRSLHYMFVLPYHHFQYFKVLETARWSTWQQGASRCLVVDVGLHKLLPGDHNSQGVCLTDCLCVFYSVAN